MSLSRLATGRDTSSKIKITIIRNASTVEIAIINTVEQRKTPFIM
jgi:hypothetical protein